MKAVRLRITGKVQGVFYRAWAEAEARRRGLHGFVRNRRDGSVEMLLVGPPEKVEEMIAAAHEGPPAARVDAVAVEPAQGVVPARFEIKPTV